MVPTASEISVRKRLISSSFTTEYATPFWLVPTQMMPFFWKMQLMWLLGRENSCDLRASRVLTLCKCSSRTIMPLRSVPIHMLLPLSVMHLDTSPCGMMSLPSAVQDCVVVS